MIRIYPNAASAIRLMGAQLVEHDEVWETNGKYLDMLEYQEWKVSRNASETIRAAAAERHRCEGCLFTQQLGLDQISRTTVRQTFLNHHGHARKSS